jgi:hypothetical protein
VYFRDLSQRLGLPSMHFSTTTTRLPEPWGEALLKALVRFRKQQNDVAVFRQGNGNPT